LARAASVCVAELQPLFLPTRTMKASGLLPFATPLLPCPRPERMFPPGKARMAVVGFLWFASSSVLSTYADTRFLLIFDSSVAHTVIRFGSSATLGFVTRMLQPKKRTVQETWQLMWGFRVQAACLFAANHMNSMALRLSGITLCCVCKASIPVLTVGLMLLRGKRFEPMIYLSLMPAVLGVTLASISDVKFSWGGLVAALGSALAQTLLNVTSKARLEQLEVSGPDAQFLMAAWCFLASIPMYLLSNSDVPPWSQAMQCPVALGVTILSGAAYHIEYVLNFMFIPCVNPLAFSVTDIARRLTKIVLGACFFHTVLTVPNMVGIVMALGGVLWYSCLKFNGSQDQAGRRKLMRMSSRFF